MRVIEGALINIRYVMFIEVKTCHMLCVELVYEIGKGDIDEHCTNHSKYR